MTDLSHFNSASSPHRRIELSILSTGRVLKLNQRPLATRAPSLTSFSGTSMLTLRCKSRQISSREYAFSLRPFQDAKEALSIVKKDVRYFVSQRLRAFSNAP